MRRDDFEGRGVMNDWNALGLVRVDWGAMGMMISSKVPEVTGISQHYQKGVTGCNIALESPYPLTLGYDFPYIRTFCSFSLDIL